MVIRKYFLLIAFLSIAFSSCKTKTNDPLPAVDPVVQAATDDALIQSYIQTNNISAIKDPSGLYYYIITAGTGPSPTTSSIINVNYTAKLLNGTIFDSSLGTTLPLGSLIAGWQIGLPHTNAGGTILLIVPSGLAYGNNVVGVVPPNSVLIFNISLGGFN